MSAALLALVLAAAPDAGLSPLVDLARVAPSVVVDLRYATADNVMKKAVYPPSARCLVVKELADALVAASKQLERKGLGLKVWDCYRPLSVQWELWKVMPQRGYVADPRTGSHHNRGAAVDLTLVTKDGAELEMPSPYDTFGRPAHHWYKGGSEASKKNRQTLRDLMEAVGLERNPMEWWHYQLVDAVRWPLRDEPFAAESKAVTTPDGGGPYHSRR